MKQNVFTITLLLCIIIGGCSPQKKLNRLYETNPHLFRNDTTIVNDTIVVPVRSIDHTTALPVGKDTVIIFRNHQSKMNGRLQLKYVYDTVVVSMSVQTEPDTIPYVKTHITNQQPRTVTPTQPKTNSWTKLWIGIVIGLTAFISLKIATKLLFK